MEDVFGLLFLLALAAVAFLGLRAISKKRTRTEEEFEKGAAESASLLSAGVSALQGVLDPADGRGKESVRELRNGRDIKKGRDEMNILVAARQERGNNKKEGAKHCR